MSYPNPLPPGWFAEPCRAWWPDFQSATCTPGHPLCCLTYAELLLVRRKERAADAARREAIRGKRPFRFSNRHADSAGPSELIWRHVMRYGPVSECDAALMVKCQPGKLLQRVSGALSARVLSRRVINSRWVYEQGDVMPQGVVA